MAALEQEKLLPEFISRYEGERFVTIWNLTADGAASHGAP